MAYAGPINSDRIYMRDTRGRNNHFLKSRRDAVTFFSFFFFFFLSFFLSTRGSGSSTFNESIASLDYNVRFPSAFSSPPRVDPRTIIVAITSAFEIYRNVPLHLGSFVESTREVVDETTIIDRVARRPVSGHVGTLRTPAPLPEALSASSRLFGSVTRICERETD